MKKVTLIMKFAAVTLIAGVLALLFLYSKQQEANTKSSSRISVPALGPAAARPEAVEWSGVDDKGNTLDLQQLRGQIVHIVFWAQWCAPCQRELPALNKYALEKALSGYKILLFNLDENDSDRDVARKMLRELAPDLTAVYQNTASYAEQMHVEALPYHVVIDRSGHIAATFIAAITDNLPAFQKIIEGL